MTLRDSKGGSAPCVRRGCLDRMGILALVSQISPSMHMIPRTWRFMNEVPIITLTANLSATRNATRYIDGPNRTRRATLLSKRSLLPFASHSGGIGASGIRYCSHPWGRSREATSLVLQYNAVDTTLFGRTDYKETSGPLKTQDISSGLLIKTSPHATPASET